MAYRILTADEMAAVQAFAKHYGRRWKSILNETYWYNARVWRDETGDTDKGHILHGLRNDLGPRWLTGFKLPALALSVPARPVYVVKRLDGSIVRPGDDLTSFRGEPHKFYDCKHPRKVLVGTAPLALQEYYPSVFDLIIEESI